MKLQLNHLKSTLLLLVVFSIQFGNAFQQPSKINSVTVYLDGAEIHRETTVKLNTGKSEITLTNLSPYIEESSIQISGLDKGSILSINYGINYLSKQNQTDSISTLQNEIKKLDEKIQNQYHLISGYNEELSLIQNNKQLGNATQVVSLEKLKTFATYYRTRITELKTEISKSNSKINTYKQSQTNIKQQLTEFNIEEKTKTGEIKLKLNSDTVTSLTLKIKYNIKNAGWFPIYDLKAEKINQPINLEYKAHVYQNSGCDWEDVDLILSTNDPNTNNEKPTVNPKYLNFISNYSNYQSQRATRNYNYKYNPLVKTVSGIVTLDSDGLPVPGVSVIEKGTTNGVQTDFDGKYTLKTTTGNAIVYSYVGMNSEEIPIHSSIMNVALTQDNNKLEEVIVIGYGTTTKEAYKASEYNNKVQKMIDEDFDDQPYVKPINYTATGNIIETGITNTSFKIDKKHSIPSDGDITVIEIDKFNVPATYNYFAAPIINENVFLTAKIGNWEQYNLLPAEANVYFEGSYSGKTNINPSATTDSLTVSLGVDPNIIVKRTQLNDFKKTTFIGNNKVVNKAYEIEIKNNKTSTIKLTLLDRIPKSQNRDIKIDDIETGNSNYNEEQGILKWELNLESGVIEKLKHSYSVKFPKGKRLNL
ncbi:mucoidy inhibitor MuiA family protein [Winogradskyella litoriviva]|uniref:Mucoidy inhibitor MuiA family protein n=1 Tax=Winogradskyella litoriviva TaxID=1220182 RepID=A0ABX2E5N2_9FLAO|nr:DUF4139 domain-containing protein [Winogradskyella litoriviva]NRD23712.1 mucoidy inhibitor MuiA family protein [Winogradskyella litoriviva]